jgi:hypothetical protein
MGEVFKPTEGLFGEERSGKENADRENHKTKDPEDGENSGGSLSKAHDGGIFFFKA